MTAFKGFPEKKPETVAFPSGFFSDFINQIADASEMKIILFSLRLFRSRESIVKFLTMDDFIQDGDTASCFLSDSCGDAKLREALKKACEDGFFIPAAFEEETYYFLNDPRSKAAIKAMQRGSWTPASQNHPAALAAELRPNVYQLYESNFGPLTPILAETLKEAEQNYPFEWIEDAVKTALKKNVRNWSYVEAILRSWKEKGRSEKNQRDNQENPRHYIEGDLADYIKH